MNVLFVRLARVGALLALAVVMLGAWVRLTDAGLGCPDWPGCYGRLVVPDAATTSPAELGGEYTRPLEEGKAWREMIHRYLASTLGLICVALAVIAWRNRRDPNQPWRAPIALVALVIMQGLLGMWTVTLLLKPIVVVGHLLGGEIGEARPHQRRSARHQRRSHRGARIEVIITIDRPNAHCLKQPVGGPDVHARRGEVYPATVRGKTGLRIGGIGS